MSLTMERRCCPLWPISSSPTISAACSRCCCPRARSRPWSGCGGAARGCREDSSLLREYSGSPRSRFTLAVVPARGLGHPPVVSLNYDAGETVGWQAFVREIGTFYESLPAAARSSTTVLASNYGEASAVGHLDPPQQSSWRQQRRARRTSVGVLAASRILDHDMAAPSRLRLTQLSASVLARVSDDLEVC